MSLLLRYEPPPKKPREMNGIEKAARRRALLASKGIHVPNLLLVTPERDWNDWYCERFGLREFDPAKDG